MFTWCDDVPTLQSLSFPAPSCLSAMLWDQTKQLPKELLRRVEDVYRAHFPLEVRLHLAAWIEEKFSPVTPFVQEDPDHHQAACQVSQELLSQLDAGVAAMPNDPEKFLMKGKLGEIAESLKVSCCRL